MALNEIDTLLFDLDGTLVDSAPDLAASVNFAPDRLHQPERTLNEVRSWIGSGVDRLLHRAITGQRDGQADESQFLQAKADFLTGMATISPISRGSTQASSLRSKRYIPLATNSPA
jgi:phosphoglycolate phosphatase